MARRRTTDREILAGEVRRWDCPKGFRVKVIEGMPSGRPGLEMDGPDGCRVVIVPARADYAEIPVLLDRGVHALLRDHCYCSTLGPRDRPLHDHGVRFDRWADRYAFRLLCRTLKRRSPWRGEPDAS